MSDFVRLLVIFVAAVNPASVLGAIAAGGLTRRTETIATGVAVGLAGVALAAIFSEEVLNALDLEPETFRISAGIVMATIGALAVLRGADTYAVQDGWPGGLFPLGVPLLAGPAALAAALAYPDDSGRWETAAAALIVVAATGVAGWAFAKRPHVAHGALARVTGALLIAFAARLIVDGVRDI